MNRLRKMVSAAFPEVMRDDALRGVVENLSTTAQGVRLLEAMTNRLKEPSASPKGGGDSAPVSQDGIRSLMRDPAYSNPHHPRHHAVVAAVETASKRLYGAGRF